VLINASSLFFPGPKPTKHVLPASNKYTMYDDWLIKLVSLWIANTTTLATATYIKPHYLYKKAA